MSIGGIGEIDFGADSGKKKNRFAINDKLFLESLLKEIGNEEATSDVVKTNKTALKNDDLSALAARSILGKIPDISGDITPEKLSQLSDLEAMNVLNPLINKYLSEYIQAASAA
ncbi:hypothetical protein DID80_05170 [Candidatus Marinamargulisbacteria bacterium SCGC AAA071-K20]|nr:hypothetical protein DID80_05170 [Candidatus Marinamargulisbacteria bacterium SCGC AAA071-K20]